MGMFLAELWRWVFLLLWFIVFNEFIEPALNEPEVRVGAIYLVLMFMPVVYLIMRKSLIVGLVHNKPLSSDRSKTVSSTKSVSQDSFQGPNDSTEKRVDIDKTFFLIATEELDKGQSDPALWAKGMALHQGDEEKARYEYINLRVEELHRGLEKSSLADEEETEPVDSGKEESPTSFRRFIGLLFFGAIIYLALVIYKNSGV